MTSSTPQPAANTSHDAVLSADIRALLADLIGSTSAPAGWTDYERAKRRISEACDGNTDLYERASAAFCRAVDL